MKNFLTNIWQGFHLALFLKTDLSQFRFGSWQAAFLMLLLSTITVAIEYLSASPDAYFNRYAIPEHLLGWSLAFTGFFLIGQYLGRENTGRFIVVALSGLIPYTIITGIYAAFSEKEELFSGANQDLFFTHFLGVYGLWLFFLALFIWEATIIYRSSRMTFNAAKVKAWAVSILYLIFLYATFFSLTTQAKLFWSPSGDYETESNYLDINIEDVYYLQPTLVSQAIENIETRREENTNVFLITFASYGYQNVFKKEVTFVKNAISERYDTKNRAISLINHSSTITELPLANKPNMRQAIAGVKKKMSDNDVLFLYLTSHGSKNAELSASFWPINPNAMDAIALREILDESQVKWRIIVVSACYSGSFIEALKNEHSLIITASSAENTSFGCSNDRELTYFAEALFDYAWPRSNSILEAFELAKTWVTEKEISEGKTPSEPQIYIGEQVGEMLKNIDDGR